MWGKIKLIIAATVTFGFMAMHEMHNDYQTITLVMAILLAGWIANREE